MIQHQDRASLIEAQRTAVRSAERRAWSIPGALEMTVWGALLMMAAALSEVDSPLSDAFVPFWGVVALLGGWRLLRRVRQLLAARAEAEAWAVADRTAEARGLPTGALAREDRTMYDARDADDLAEVASQVRVQAQARLYDLRLVSFMVLLSPLPIVVLLSTLIGLSNVEKDVTSLLLLSTAVIVGVPLVVVLRVWVQTLWRRQQRFNVVGTEGEAWLARRRVLTGVEAVPPGPVPLVVRAKAVLFVALLALLIVRLLTVRIEATVIVGGLLVVAGLAVGVKLLRLRAMRRLPLDDGGPHPVEVRREERGLRLVAAGGAEEVPYAEILAVEPVELGYPFAPPAVAVITRGEPIVLAGGEAVDLLRLAPERQTTS